MIRRFAIGGLISAMLAGAVLIIAQDQPKKGQGPNYTLNVEVNLVVLHVSVMDEKEKIGRAHV
jgi:hypothetical protein